MILKTQYSFHKVNFDSLGPKLLTQNKYEVGGKKRGFERNNLASGSCESKG